MHDIDQWMSDVNTLNTNLRSLAVAQNITVAAVEGEQQQQQQIQHRRHSKASVSSSTSHSSSASSASLCSTDVIEQIDAHYRQIAAAAKQQQQQQMQQNETSSTSSAQLLLFGKHNFEQTLVALKHTYKVLRQRGDQLSAVLIEETSRQQQAAILNRRDSLNKAFENGNFNSTIASASANDNNNFSSSSSDNSDSGSSGIHSTTSSTLAAAAAAAAGSQQQQQQKQQNSSSSASSVNEEEEEEEEEEDDDDDEESQAARQADKAEKRLRDTKIRHIVNELVETERVYVDELKIVIDVGVKLRRPRRVFDLSLV